MYPPSAIPACRHGQWNRCPGHRRVQAQWMAMTVLGILASGGQGAHACLAVSTSLRAPHGLRPALKIRDVIRHKRGGLELPRNCRASADLH